VSRPLSPLRDPYTIRRSRTGVSRPPGVYTPPTPPSQAYNPVVDADTPVSHWKLGYTAGATSAADRVGAKPLTSVNAAVTFGATGLVVNNAGDTAASFTPSAALGRPSATEFTGSTGFTVEAWVRTTLDATLQTFVSKADGSVNWLWGIDFKADHTIDFWLQSGAKYGYAHAIGGTWAINTTYHVAATYDASTMLLYVNGSQVGTSGTGITMYHDTGDDGCTLSVGSQGAAANAWQGTLDEVAYYGAALTSTRVAAHRTAGI